MEDFINQTPGLLCTNSAIKNVNFTLEQHTKHDQTNNGHTYRLGISCGIIPFHAVMSFLDS